MTNDSSGSLPAQTIQSILMITLGLKERQSKVDWSLFLAVSALMLIGTAFIYSATMANESAIVAPWYRQRFFMQGLWYLVGSGAAALVCLVDYHILARWGLV